jgi:ribose-phosphate pyrophosphokinase
MTSQSSPLVLIAGDASRTLDETLARELGVQLTPAEVGSFADGEMRVEIRADVRDATVILLQSTCPPVNDRLMALALMSDAARAAGAARIIAVAPYFGYARQERRGRVGEPRSAQVAARLLHAVSLDHLVTLDLHAPALESAFPMPATLLEAQEVFLPLVRTWVGQDPTVIVAPDAGAVKRAQRFAAALGASASIAVVTKQRPRPDVAGVRQVLGHVDERTCVLVDDMVSTGQTLAGAAEALKAANARTVHALFTHAVMAPGALERLLASPLARLATSDSVMPPAHPRLEIAATAPVLAGVLRQLVRCGLPPMLG